jgi:AcrR family transcriptional regulator
MHGIIVPGATVNKATTPPRTVLRRRRAAEPTAPAAAIAGSLDTPEPERAALTPAAWTDAATEVLVDQGIDHVRVDVLARQLGVTRGSFYWHFRDREALLRSVLQAWNERTTDQLTRRLETAHADPAEQLRDVISLPFRGRAATRGARIELAIRAWARRDAMARQAVDASDANRMAYIAQVFSALGFAPAEARSRAFLLYAYVVGESLMANQGGAAQRQERARFVERLMRRELGG